MKIRDFNLKLSRVIVICLIVSILTGAIVYATSTQPFTINRGIYPGGPSFTVWEEDGTYFAKNPYGVIAYSGTDAAIVINNAVADGTSIYITAGYYEIDTPIEIDAISETSQSQAIRIYGDSLTGDAYFTKVQSSIPEGTVIAAESGYTGSLLSISPNNASLTGVKNLEIDHLTLSGMPLPYATETYTDLDMSSADAGICAANIQNCHFHHLTIINCYYGIFITTNGWTNDGVELNHIWLGYNRYGINVYGNTQLISIHQIYSYLNYGNFLYLACGRGDVYDIFSNGDEWELEDSSAITFISNGLITARGIFIQNAKDAIKDGVRGIHLYIGKENASICLSEVTIQGVKTGDGLKINDVNKAGFIYLNKIFASPSETSFLGGEGDIGAYGIIENQDDGTYISVSNSVFQNCGDMGMYGDYSFISNTWNGTTYIQSYP